MSTAPIRPALDSVVVDAWHHALAETAQEPWLARLVVQRSATLLPRFCHFYTQLRALPRRTRRALQRQLALSMAGAALLLALGHGPAHATTIPVDGTVCTLADAITAANTDMPSGGCAAGSGADTLVLDPGSTHTLTSALPTISSDLTINGQGATITRDQNAPPFGILTVVEATAFALNAVTITGGSSGRGVAVFGRYGGGSRCTITDSTISGNAGGGVAVGGETLCTIIDSTISGNTAGGGGGIRVGVYSGVTIVGSTISNNTADESGGGIYGLKSGVTIVGSTISGNTAGREGGGVYVERYSLTITDSIISGNMAGDEGGGVAAFVRGGGVTIARSTISGNTANRSGGISARSEYAEITITDSIISNNNSGISARSEDAEITITDSIISNNNIGGVDAVSFSFDRGVGVVTIINSTISDNGGNGITAASTAETIITNSTISGNRGRGISAFSYSYNADNADAEIIITNSTISGNRAGGVFARSDGITTLSHSTITANTGGGLNASMPAELTHTIVAGNTDEAGEFADCTGPLTSLGHNLVGTGTGCPSDASGDLRVDPADVFVTILEALQPNGGLTPTHALLPGSLAIDGGAAVCPAGDGTSLVTDQRGKPRPIDGNADGRALCDIGAFEFFPIVNFALTLTPDLVTDFNPMSVPGGPAGTFTITATFTNTSAVSLHFPFFGVQTLSGENQLLNADAGAGGIGATLTPPVDGEVLAPGDSVSVDFVIGLQEQEQFTFFVNLFGEPLF
jgi:parallel beta-helix repeat protein